MPIAAELNMDAVLAFARYVASSPDELWIDADAAVVRAFGIGETYLQGAQAMLEMFFCSAWPDAYLYGRPLSITGAPVGTVCDASPDTLGFGAGETLGGVLYVEPPGGGALPLAIKQADTTTMRRPVEGCDVLTQVINTIDEYCELLNQTLANLPPIWRPDRRETRREPPRSRAAEMVGVGTTGSERT
jgi:hypothetical protein